MKKAALYVRVSTPHQEKEGYSIEEQKMKLKSFATAKDYEVVNIYVDGGISGAKIDRPALQEMIEDIENGKIDVVLVYKLDRLSRSQKNTMYLIEDVFLKNNVDFISMQESFDTTTPFGRAMIGILSVFAQLERDNIAERMMMGRIARAKKGLYRGGNNIPTGYKYEEGNLVIDPATAPIVTQIFSDYVFSRKSMYEIFRDLQKKYGNIIYGHSFIKRVLDNDVYIGKNSFAGDTYEGTHEPIISSDLFEAAQERRNDLEDKYKIAKNKRSALLARKLFCGHCGASIVKINHYKNGEYVYSYYVCNSHRKSRPNGVKDPNCPQKNCRTDIIDASVIDIMKKINYEEKLAQLKCVPLIPETNELEIKKLKKQKDKLIDLYQFDLIEIEEYNKRLNKIKDKMDSLKPNISKKNQSRIAIFESFKNFDWDNSTFEEQCFAIDSLVKRVIRTNEKIEVILYD